MAIIASTTSVGVARGFNFAKNVGRTRTFPRGTSGTPSSSGWTKRAVQRSSLYFRGGASSFNGGSSLTSCFAASGGANEDGTTSTATIDKSTEEANDIEQAAKTCLAITGSLPPPCSFGGISYLDTSSLDTNHAHRVIFILGGPGAGKGTQSEQIVSTYKCVHLSVGELLRSGAEKEGFEHAELVKECLVQGKIVPVEVSLGLLRIAMDEKANEVSNEDCDKGYGSRIFLVDGFPRNFDNVNGWMKNMPSYTAVLGALVYNCPMVVLEQRILSRAETSGRSDDNLDSAKRRFSTFQKETEPVVRALERAEEMQKEENGGSQLNIVNIDGTGTVEEVWQATEEAMNSYVKNDVLTANMKALREEGDDVVAAVSNAQVDMIDGIEAVVSYDRDSEDGESTIRETRKWKHGPAGWRCVDVKQTTN